MLTRELFLFILIVGLTFFALGFWLGGRHRTAESNFDPNVIWWKRKAESLEKYADYADRKIADLRSRLGEQQNEQ